MAFDLESLLLYDDNLDGYESITEGARLYPWVAGALWPEMKKRIVGKTGGWRLPHRRGVYISPKANIGMMVTFGDHAHILAGATVSHGCYVGEFATVATGANLCGEVHVGAGAFIGAGTTIIHGGIRIGENAVVGAGSVVLEDVPAGEKWVGSPARPKAMRL
jgi:acyl-[acyl carrier protein]--UDP-N-acetylglucosamine O-acyltransferase